MQGTECAQTIPGGGSDSEDESKRELSLIVARDQGQSLAQVIGFVADCVLPLSSLLSCALSIYLTYALKLVIESSKYGPAGLQRLLSTLMSTEMKKSQEVGTLHRPPIHVFSPQYGNLIEKDNGAAFSQAEYEEFSSSAFCSATLHSPYECSLRKVRTRMAERERGTHIVGNISDERS